VKNFFVSIYRFFVPRRILLIAIFFLLIGTFAFLASQLKLESDLSAMLPKDQGKKDVTSILTNNKQLDKIIASVSIQDTTIADPELLVSFVNEFSELLIARDSTKIISRVEDKQDEERFLDVLTSIHHNLPFLLDEHDYTKIDSMISLKQIRSTLASNYRTLASPGGIAMKQLIADDPVGISFLALRKMKDLQQDENTSLYDGHIMSNDQKTITFFIHSVYPSSNTKRNEGLAALINSTAEQLKQKSAYKQIDFNAFGGQMVAAGNASQMRADTILTLSITILLLLTLFVFFFRSFFAPLQIMIPVVFGGLFGMAMMYLLREKVSMISLGASSVILGIAVNYSLHFLSHLRHSHNKEETIRELSLPMTIGGFTTIFAFFSLTLLHTPVLQELGLFTAFNLIGSSICTLIFLPHFIQPKAVKNNAAESGHRTNWLDKLSLFSPNKNKWIVIGICLVTIILGYHSNNVRFNEDMMKMNFMTPELQHSQAVINAQNAESLNSVFCVNEGSTLDEALKKNAASNKLLDELKHEGIIRKYSSIGSYILADSVQHEKLERWNSYWTTEKKLKLLNMLQQEGADIGFDKSAFEGITTILQKEYSQTDEAYRNTFNDLFKDFIIKDAHGYKLMVLIKTSQDKRAELYRRFEHVQAGYLTDRQLITTEFVRYVKDDFYKILFLTSFIVFFTILVSYGRIELALISFIPMVVTWICILGLMGLLHIEFNIINIIISTLIFGLGDDYSIFITDGLLEKYKYGKLKINSIKASIYLSAITTIIGLGILIFAKHPALRSIALVSVIGIFSILLVSQTLQPLLFNFLIQNRTEKKQHPFTLWSFLKTIFAFTFYALGCTLITIIGFILTRCIPFAKDKMKYLYHVIICKGMWTLLYTMCNTKKTILGKEHANWNKPAVIIANHASFLDLLRIISLHPKLLLLTNKWVWRSPVFGMLVRMADYYSVEEGAEFSINKLRYWVDRGYSIAVFPEGTRSYDDEVKRFHKGAFYLAEQLHLDIQPILFHGIGNTMRKGDFLLKNGEVNSKYLPRIPPTDTSFGINYSERAKHIGRYFRKEYDTLRNERQTVHYFREQLVKNYMYKGPVLEWYCRIKTKLENNYELIEGLVPKKANVLDIGCGYGFLAYMLSFTSKERTLFGIDYDEEKIEVAAHNFSKTVRINFAIMDALALPTDKKYDCILLMDVLHYLTPTKQEILLNKIYSLLSQDGVFILRDGITEMSRKIKGTRLTEFFSTTMFGFNKTSNDLHFISMAGINAFALKNRLELKVVDETKFTSNVVVVMKKNSSIV